MGGEVIKRPLLAGQLAKECREDRPDQRGLAGSVLAHKRDEAGAQRLEIHADRAGKGFGYTAQTKLMDFHAFTPRN